jgi:hypothetical protein
MIQVPCPMRHAPCAMPHAPCPMRHAPCAVPQAPCPMRRTRPPTSLLEPCRKPTSASSVTGALMQSYALTQRRPGKRSPSAGAVAPAPAAAPAAPLLVKRLRWGWAAGRSPAATRMWVTAALSVMRVWGDTPLGRGGKDGEREGQQLAANQAPRGVPPGPFLAPLPCPRVPARPRTSGPSCRRG